MILLQQFIKKSKWFDIIVNEITDKIIEIKTHVS